MTKATISSKGQIAIPKAIRDRLNLKPGTQVAFDIEGEQVVMKRLVSGLPDWRTMRGMVRIGPSLTKALEEEHRAELAREDERIHRNLTPAFLTPGQFWRKFGTSLPPSESMQFCNRPRPGHSPART